MTRPTKRQELLRAAREGQAVRRVAVPRVACPRCARDVYALPDGSPRPHLRPTRPGEADHNDIVPTRTNCD